MLERRHALAKLIAAVLLVLTASVLERLPALALIAMITTAMLVLIEQRPLLRLARGMLPFLFLAAAMSWVYLVAENPAHRAVGGSGAWVAALVAARILTMGLVSLAFAETTRPDDLARALEQNARVPRPIAQGVLAAIQFLPALAEDYRMQRLLARSLQNAEGASAWRARFHRLAPGRLFELALILIAGAIRRASAAALSMQIRGLGPETPASLWRRRELDRADRALVLGAIALATGAGIWSAMG